MGNFFLTRIDPVGVGVQCVAMQWQSWGCNWTWSTINWTAVHCHCTPIALLLHSYCTTIALLLHFHCTTIGLHCTAMTELGLQLNLEYNKLHYHCSAIGLPLHCHCISIAQALDNHCTVELGLQLKLERRQIRRICLCQQASLRLFCPRLHRTLHVVLTSQFHCELYNILCMLV